MRFRVLGIVVGVVLALVAISVVLAVFPAEGVGQGSSDIWVMNLNETLDASVVASYVNRSGGQDTSIGSAISSLGNTSFPASSSGLPNDWLGSMVMYSDRELASVAELFWRNVPRGDGWSGGAYYGYSEGANELFFPGIAKTPYHRTIATVQCVDVAACDVSMTWRDLDGIEVAGSPFMDSIEPDSQESYDLHDPSLNPQIPTGLASVWQGSLQVTSTNKIAGVMVVHWLKGYAAAQNAIVPTTQTMVNFVGLNRRNFNGDWTGQSDWSGFTLQNLNPFSVTVHVAFYDSVGASVLELDHDIPAYSAGLFNLRYGGSVDRAIFEAALGDSFIGSAVVSSTNPIGGVGGTIRIPSSGLAGQYVGESSGSGRLAYPMVYRVKSGSSWLNFSSFGVQNLDPVNPISVTVKCLLSDGTVGLEFDETVPANSTIGYSTRYGGTLFAPMGDSWAGPVIVTTTSPAGITGGVTSFTQGPGYMYMTSNNFIHW